MDYLSQQWTFWLISCHIVHLSGIGPGFATPTSDSAKEPREKGLAEQPETGTIKVFELCYL
jgi:hypothetical protein